MLFIIQNLFPQCKTFFIVFFYNFTGHFLCIFNIFLFFPTILITHHTVFYPFISCKLLHFFWFILSFYRKWIRQYRHYLFIFKKFQGRMSFSHESHSPLPKLSIFAFPAPTTPSGQLHPVCIFVFIFFKIFFSSLDTCTCEIPSFFPISDCV